MKQKEAEQAFYRAIGSDMDERVILGKDGLTLHGRFTNEQLKIICAAHARYLAAVANKADPEKPLML